MYIPNLVGKQILRVPVLPCEEQTLSTTPALSRSVSIKSPYIRGDSPVVSEEEVSSDDE